MPFTDIVGYQRQLETLRRNLQGDRLHHACLFVGPDGVGKKTVALLLAAAIHCPEMEHDSCGQCESCLCIRDGNHPDVHVVRPGAGKAGISIQQIRDLQRQLAFRPFSGKKKIAIVEPAHLLNYHAQNSLLKTLEDPPSDSLLILIGNSIGSLLPTVLSRCLRLDFPLLTARQVADILIRRKGIPADRAMLLAALSKGRPGEALNCDADRHFDQRREWTDRLSALSRDDFPAAMELAQQVGGEKERSLEFLEWIEGWYRDILIHQVGSTGQITNPDMVEKIRECSDPNDIEHTLSVLSRIGGVAGEIRRNYNRRLVLEHFLINIVLPGTKPSPGEI